MLVLPAKLEVQILVLAFVHTLSMRAAKALASLRVCAASPEPLPLADAISTETSSYTDKNLIDATLGVLDSLFSVHLPVF